MQKEATADDIFNALNYFDEIHGIRVYRTDKIDPGDIVEGKTYEQKKKPRMFIETGVKTPLDLAGIKKITHLAAHPRTILSLVSLINKGYETQRN